MQLIKNALLNSLLFSISHLRARSTLTYFFSVLSDVVKGRKFVPEKVLEFCAESKATDEASLFEVEVQITQNGKKSN